MAIQNYTTTLPSPGTTVSDAAYRATGAALEAIFTGLGFVRTADTGMANWSTDTNITTATYAGKYVLFTHPDDPLSGTDPLIVGFRLGRPSTGGSSGYTAQFVAATATDGAGTPTSSLYVVTTGAAVSTGNIVAGSRVYASTDGEGGLVIQTAAPAMFNLILERTRDGSGAANGDGFFWGGYCSNSSTNNGSDGLHFYGVESSTGASLNWDFVSPFTAPVRGTGMANPSLLSYLYDGGAKSACLLGAVMVPGRPPWVLKQIMAASQIDGTNLPADVYGETHNYYVPPSPTQGTGLIGVLQNSSFQTTFSSSGGAIMSTVQPVAQLWS